MAFNAQELAPQRATWRETLVTGVKDWLKSSFQYLLRLGPAMVLAGFAGGLVIQWVTPETVAKYLGDNLSGVVIAATFGILINVPLLFEIPLVAVLLMVGMGTAPAAALLFGAAAGGPFTFWGLSRVMPKKAVAVFAAGTWSLSVIGGAGLLFVAPIFVGDLPATASMLGGSMVDITGNGFVEETTITIGGPEAEHLKDIF